MKWKSPRCSAACWDEIREHEAERSKLLAVLTRKSANMSTETSVPTSERLTEESGWLIERGDSEVSAPKYWAAGMLDPSTFSAWTSNHLQAIRFARKIDAERVAERLIKDITVRVAEHMWIDAEPLSDTHRPEGEQ